MLLLNIYLAYPREVLTDMYEEMATRMFLAYCL